MSIFIARRRNIFRLSRVVAYNSTCPTLEVFGNVLGGENLTEKDPTFQTFKAWHNAVNTINLDLNQESREALATSLSTHVHKNCTFHPPTYYSHWTGRDEFILIISCVTEVFGKSFKYGRQWISSNGREWALEFTANIGDTKKQISGIDLVSLDEDGKIIEFKVLARPPNAVDELKKAMMQKVPVRMAKLKAKQSLSSIFG